MKRKLIYLSCTLLCLAACVSCYEKDKPVPVKTKAVPFEETIDPTALFPELTKLQSIRYDDEMGYYIPFSHVGFTQYWTCDPVFIPSQSCSFTATANQVEEEDFSLDTLYALLQDRKATLPEGSYTSYLFQKGLDKILKKVGEETTEVIIAAKDKDKKNTVYEIADLAYHVMVLMIEAGISLEDIHKELASRHVIDKKVKQEKMV